ncbi:MAG: toprim domain-containing protein [Streptosporangiaceae bacterium]|nr:toprim domain-containing protein [Streptosporangiaceae bacterium]
MNGNGEAWDRPADQGQAAELAARVSATADRATAVLGRAGTTGAFLCPPAVTRDPELVQIHAEAGRFFQACLTGSWVPDYLASRGLDAALLPTSPWKIGYAPATWTALTDHLHRLGHSDAALLCSGLVTNRKNGQLRDRFHDRLMIPLRAEDGIVVAFIGRRPGAGDDHGPKYLNSPDTELFTKGHVLAGLAEGRNALKAGAQPVLAEGPLDAIAVSIAAPGQFTGITPCGTALTGHQAAALARAVELRERGMRVAMDADAAGRKAAVRAHATLSPLVSGVIAVTFPDNADPSSILENDGRQALADVLIKSTRPLADLVVDARIEDWAYGRELKFAELQIGALRAAAQAIATMPADEVGPQAARLSATFAHSYGWKPEEVTREVIDAIERHYQGGPLARPVSGHSYHPADSPWAVVLRATAPPHPRLAAADLGQATPAQIVRHTQLQQTRQQKERA